MSRTRKSAEGCPSGGVLEVVACSVADAIEAEKGGAGPLEFIRDFEVGGLAPRFELVRDILGAVALPVRVMLRESYRYTVADEAEFLRLCESARRVADLGADGVVLGFPAGGEFDLARMEQILASAGKLKATCHHAFDEVAGPLQAIRGLKRLGNVDRILTSGGPGGWPQEIERLGYYEREAKPEISVLAGGGLDAEVIGSILRTTGICEFHVGRAARVPAHASGLVQAV